MQDFIQNSSWLKSNPGWICIDKIKWHKLSFESVFSFFQQPQLITMYLKFCYLQYESVDFFVFFPAVCNFRSLLSVHLF